MQMVPKQYLKNVSAGLVVRVKQGCGKPTRIYLAESEGRKTDRQEGRKTDRQEGRKTDRQEGRKTVPKSS